MGDVPLEPKNFTCESDICGVAMCFDVQISCVTCGLLVLYRARLKYLNNARISDPYQSLQYQIILTLISDVVMLCIYQLPSISCWLTFFEVCSCSSLYGRRLICVQF